MKLIVNSDSYGSICQTTNNIDFNHLFGKTFFHIHYHIHYLFVYRKLPYLPLLPLLMETNGIEQYQFG